MCVRFFLEGLWVLECRLMFQVLFRFLLEWFLESSFSMICRPSPGPPRFFFNVRAKPWFGEAEQSVFVGTVLSSTFAGVLGSVCVAFKYQGSVFVSLFSGFNRWIFGVLQGLVFFVQEDLIRDGLRGGLL